MDKKSAAFLEAVLGAQGAQALAKAAERVPALADALVPRAALAWLGAAGAFEYEGEVPGVPGTHMALSKSAGEFTGSVQLPGGALALAHAGPARAAAAISMAIGLTPEALAKGAASADVAKLGASMDRLAKARLAVAMRKKSLAAAPKAGAAEEAGAAAGANAPEAPAGPANTSPAKGVVAAPSRPVAASAASLAGKRPTQVAGAAAAAAKPKAQPQAPKIRVTKSQMSSLCPTCGRPQFSGVKFAGCLCFSALSKSVSVAPAPLGVTLTLGDGWGPDEAQSLLESLRGEP